MSNEVKIGLAIIAIAFIIEGLIAYVEDNYQPTAQLVQERAAAYADLDHDGIISHREWMNIYERIGVPYRAEHAERLTTYHFRQFVRFYSKD